MIRPAFSSPINRGKPDTGCDRMLQTGRYRIDQPLAKRTERQNDEQNSRQKDAAERNLPAAAHRRNDREREIGVEPHAGRKRDRIVCENAHQGGTDGRGDAGRNEDGAEIHYLPPPGSLD